MYSLLAARERVRAKEVAWKRVRKGSARELTTLLVDVFRAADLFPPCNRQSV